MLASALLTCLLMQPTPHVLLRDARGVATVEYALLLVGILLVGAAGFKALGVGVKKQAECAASFDGPCGDGEGASVRSEWGKGSALTASEESRGIDKMAMGPLAPFDPGPPKGSVAEAKAAQAKLEADKDRLAEQEAKIPNLDKVNPNDQGATANGMMTNLRGPDGQPISQDQYNQLVNAREQVLRDEQIELPHALDHLVQDMRAHGMSRTDALAELRKEGYDAALGSTSDTLESGKMPTTIGMTDAERSAYYAKTFLSNPATSDEARFAFMTGKPVILGIHRDDRLDANDGKGVWNDRFVVLKETDGKVTAQEFNASMDPTTAYGVGNTQQGYMLPGSAPDGPVGQYARNDTATWDHDHPALPLGPMNLHQTLAPTRLADGQTIELSTGPVKNGLERLYTPSGGGYKLQGDLNGDGQFGNDGPNDTRKADDNEFQLHGSKADYSHTGTDGCVTMPRYQWDDFRAQTGMYSDPALRKVIGDGHIYYTQVSEGSLP